jgi:hypothetical protein
LKEAHTTKTKDGRRKWTEKGREKGRGETGRETGRGETGREREREDE